MVIPAGTVTAGARHRDASRSPGDAVIHTVVDAALAQLAAMPAPMRGVILGPAGSGKSTALQALRAEQSSVPTREGDDATTGSAGRTTFIDDAESLDDEELERIERLAADPSASIVLACRDDPPSPRRDRIIRLLERSGPPVLLGEVAPVQIAESTRLSTPCTEAIAGFTGSLTWLALIAVDAHDPGTCDADPAHRDLAAGLRSVISHRLAQIDAPVRGAVEALCLFPPSRIAATEPPAATWDAAIRAGWSAGLLTRNGQAPPAVRSAIRRDLPVHRLAELFALTGVEDPADWETPGWSGQSPASSIPERLLAHGDRVREADPTRAMALYGEALAAGGAAVDIGIRFGIAAVAAGDLDAAAACFDRITAVPGHPRRGEADDASLAVWAARGALRAGAEACGRLAGAPESTASAARRALVRLGAGILAPARSMTPPGPSSDTVSVASRSLDAAVTATLGSEVDGVVDDLALASEMYSASRADFPLVEPPAVVAAAAALASGRLAVAAETIAAALRAHQAGRWAQPRLLLWKAWIALMGSHPEEARGLIGRARDGQTPLQPRDRLIALVCETALARRYGDIADLTAAFHAAERTLLQQRFDVFQHPFLAELTLAAHRVGSGAGMDRHFARELSALSDLGDPPLWSPVLHWAGVQRGIIRNRPDLVVPHAHALLAAAESSPFAEHLAEAGRTWTAVLAGDVDVVRVESAAHVLARGGLTWDGARLAAHGAARSADRSAAAQLLACARELHPRERGADAPGGTGANGSPGSVDTGSLSVREVQVARLVVQGKTYVEIGQTLFISPRTAEHHIARIRRRLEASSRSDLIAKLQDALRSDGTPWGDAS